MTSAAQRLIAHDARALRMLRERGRSVVRLPSFLGYNRRMRILLSNDDGYLARGLNVLYEAMQPIGEVTVMAPEQNCSGASNSLTLSRPLSGPAAVNGFYYVNGTPTDSVHIALTGMLDHKPDLVVSGINNGQNMGEDTLYSGTVAAATEGIMFGVPAIAFSLVDQDWRISTTRRASPPKSSSIISSIRCPGIPC